jgi:RNA polymerase sigma-70 factor (ECF subfamily)
VLILRDVLDWQARETAEVLNMSLSAVTSALFRARVTLRHTYPKSTHPADLNEPHPSGLLDRYVLAWETADIQGLVSLLKEEASFAMPPFPVWFQGRASIHAFLAGELLAGEARGRWRLKPAHANGQPAFAFYRQGEGNTYRAFGLHVIGIQNGQIHALTHFLGEGLFARFGLPQSL